MRSTAHFCQTLRLAGHYVHTLLVMAMSCDAVCVGLHVFSCLQTLAVYGYSLTIFIPLMVRHYISYS